jgi:alpha-beta hydrolase superfamily lysophospholipase
MRKLIFICLGVFIGTISSAQQKITIPSKDSISITADQYIVDDSKPYIILCHQEGYSRGEYVEIAKKLNKLGYNCLAIDQRSGAEVNGVKNETAAAAAKKKKPQNYIDAEQDIIAAIDFIYFSNEKPVVLWGSSYSGALALKIATSNDKVKAVIAFSPGELLKGINLADKIKILNKPIFVTSAKSEATEVLTLTKNIMSKNKVQYIPKGAGGHGSKVLWSNSPDYLDYWTAMVLFLKDIDL